MLAIPRHLAMQAACALPFIPQMILKGMVRLNRVYLRKTTRHTRRGVK